VQHASADAEHVIEIRFGPTPAQRNPTAAALHVMASKLGTRGSCARGCVSCPSSARRGKNYASRLNAWVWLAESRILATRLVA
jgi:hypothetical protein